MKMSQYFPKPFRNFGGKINVKVDLSNYATKTDLKNATHVDAVVYCSWKLITTAQLHSTKPGLRFCAGSNPACRVLEIQDGEDL